MSILASVRQAGPSGLLTSVSRTVGLGPARPWLPAGETLRARLYRHGLEPGVGVPWLDEPGVVDAQVRLTYAASLAGSQVAVTGLALRVENPDGSVGDVLMQARGPRRGAARDTVLTTATPYVVAGVPGGLLTLGARQCGAETFELLCVAGDGEWRPFGDLRVSPRPHGGRPLDPDPLANVLPGLTTRIPAPRAS
ncbi:hypothetical protein ACT8ZV_03665 [Nocardioides sp. MAHUQ-72]|uniref:hypothetical protein n=1 Tax=unclassified Nocardioides TaxID=2615069 RepID=UPI0036147AA2